MIKNKIVEELVGVLAKDPAISTQPWQHLAMVAVFGKGSAETSGFAYLEDGKAVPASPSAYDFHLKLKELRAVTKEPDKDPWRAVLIRIERKSKKFSVDFEYDNPEKWAITPANGKEMAEKLRPRGGVNASDIIAAFGSSATDPEVVSLMKAAGIKDKPKLPRGEYTAYAGAKRAGVDLVFEDEAYFKGQDKPLGKGALILTGAQLYARGHEGFCQFEGEMPGGVTFADSRDQVATRLGASEWKREKDGVVLRERWVWHGNKVLVTFAPKGGPIQVIYVGTK